MHLTLDPRKSVEQNAEVYFEHAKKLRKKAEGAREAVARLQQKIIILEKKQERTPVIKPKVLRTKEWFEKFHWFTTSDGFLCIGGRDATTNEIIIKKHTDAQDVVFHTEMPGSPFFVIKTQGKQPSEQTIQEVAEATAAYSRAWKLGITTVDVFYVKPEQVSKQAASGEYVSKGAFVITGKRGTVTVNNSRVALGVCDNKIIAGPLSAIKKSCTAFLLVRPGKEKTSDCAKKIQHLLKAGELDDIIACIPAGGCQLDKVTTTQGKKS